MAKNMSKMDILALSRSNTSQNGHLCYLVANNISKTDTWPVRESNVCQTWTHWRSLAVSRQKHVKNGHRGRFATQTLLKNGHLGRFVAKNMSKTDTLAVLGNFAAKTRQKWTPWPLRGPNPPQKRTSWPLHGEKTDTLAVLGRFVAKTRPKRTPWSLRGQKHVQNGHFGRFAAKNMSKTDILATSRRKTCRKRTPWRSLAVLR